MKLLGGAIGSSGRVHDPSRECFELRERGRKGIFERSARTGSLSVSEPSLFKGSETLSSACDRTLAPLALVLITLSEVSGAALVAATYMLSHRRWNAGRVEIFQNDSALLMRTRCARVASRWMASSVLWTWNLLRHLSATNLGPHSQLSGRGSLRDRDDDYHSNCKIDAIRQRAPHCYGKQPLQPRDGNRVVSVPQTPSRCRKKEIRRERSIGPRRRRGIAASRSWLGRKFATRSASAGRAPWRAHQPSGPF